MTHAPTASRDGAMTNRGWRLDAKAPAMADAFRNATLEKQKLAALAACESIVPIVGLDANDEVSSALRALRAGASEPTVRERLATLSERFDDEYFVLEEDANEDAKAEARRFFAKARGASAIVFALSADTTQLHEAIYEALSALADDPARVVRAVEQALSV